MGLKMGLLKMSDEQKTTQRHELRRDTIVIAGSARLPENTATKHVFGYVTIELEINPLDTKIVDLSCTLLPLLGEKMLCSILLGNKIDEGIRDAVEQLENRFFSKTKRSIIAALEDAHRCYAKKVFGKSNGESNGPVNNVALSIDV